MSINMIFEPLHEKTKTTLCTKTNLDITPVILVIDKVWPNVKIVSKYDQEIPQSQTADNPMAPLGRASQPSRDTRKTH